MKTKTEKILLKGAIILTKTATMIAALSFILTATAILITIPQQAELAHVKAPAALLFIWAATKIYKTGKKGTQNKQTLPSYTRKGEMHSTEK